MANHIKVRTEWLDGCASDLQAVSNAIRAAQNTLAGINLTEAEGAYLKVGMSMGLTLTGTRHSANSVMQDVKALSNAVGVLSDRVSRLGTGAKNAARALDDAENNSVRLINGCAVGNTSETYSGSSQSASGATIPAVLISNDVDLVDGTTASLWTIMKEFFGAGGNGGSLIMKTADFYKKVFNGDAKLKDLLKYLVSTTKTGASWVKWNAKYEKLFNFGKGYGAKLYTKKLFGLDKYLKQPSHAKHWKDAFKRNFGTKFTESVTSASTWIFSGITSYIDNCSEGLEKHYSADRVVVEWATETATSVVVTSAATAAVGAVLAPIGAPVIVIGGVAALGVCGVDWAIKSTIGGGEYGLIDGIGHLAGESWENAKEGAKQLGHKIDNLKNRICSNIKASWSNGFIGSLAW